MSAGAMMFCKCQGFVMKDTGEVITHTFHGCRSNYREQEQLAATVPHFEDKKRIVELEAERDELRALLRRVAALSIGTIPGGDLNQVIAAARNKVWGTPK